MCFRKQCIIFLYESFTFDFVLFFYLFTATSKKEMPNLGFIPMSCKVVDMFAGDILKDLPFLKRYKTESASLNTWVEWINYSLKILWNATG